MIVVVGLGNPGREYEGTRHNLGFRALDRFADMAGASFDREGFKGSYAIVKNPLFEEDVILLKPNTFMNLSGESVQAITCFYKIVPQDVIVVYDDMALPEGSIRLRKDGSNGSHNGMGNIIKMMGTQNIKRIRIGIGEPQHTGVDWVLGKPSGESLLKIEEALDEAAKAIKDALIHGFDFAMSHHNGNGKKESL